MGVLAVTINAVDQTDLILQETFQVTDELNNRNTCEFELYDQTGAFSCAVGQAVVATWDGATVFSGTIDECEERQEPGVTGGIWAHLTCVDFNQLADRRLVVDEYVDQTLKEIAQDIVTNHLTTEDGVTLSTLQGDGPTIERALFNYQTVAESFNDLAELTGYQWNIDYDKVLRFISRNDLIAPFDVEVQADGLFNYRTLAYTRTREQYRNVQFIRGGEDLTDERTETQFGDGERKTFVLEFPVGAEPVIFVDSTTDVRSIGIRQIASTDTEFLYQIGENEIGHNAATSGDILTSTELFGAVYQGLFPIIVEGRRQDAIDDRIDVEGGSGVYTHIEDREEVNRNSLAIDLASGQLRQFGEIPELVDFQTDTEGLAAGQLTNITVAPHGITGDFLIESVSLHLWRGGQNARYDVRAVSGEPFGGFAEFFRKLAKSGRRFVIRENEVLNKLRTFTESFTVAEAFQTATSTSRPGLIACATSTNDDVIGFVEFDAKQARNRVFSKADLLGVTVADGWQSILSSDPGGGGPDQFRTRVKDVMPLGVQSCVDSAIMTS